MKAFSASLLAPLIIAVNLWGAEIRDQIPIPLFHKQSLLNGMETLFLPTTEKRVPFLLMIENGAAFDPVGKWGATYLMMRMMMERTEKRTGAEIQADLQKLGAELDVRVEWDAIFFAGNIPVNRLSDVLNVLGEIVVRPKFEEDAFQKLRDQLLKEVEQEHDRIEVMIQDLFRAELFRGNPYQHPVEGNPKTLKNLDLADIKIQYRRLILPNQAHLALYYSGDRETLFTKLSQRWGAWIKRKPAPFTFTRAKPPEEQRILLVPASSQLSLFCWGKLGVQKGAREYYALKIFEQYLTLTLPAWASQVASANQIQALSKVEAGKMPGYFQLRIRAPAEQLGLYYRKFHDFLKAFHGGHIDISQFEEARKLAFLEFKNSLQQPLSILFQLLETDLYNLGINHISNYGLRLKRVTPEQLQRTVQKYFSSDSFLMVVAGPIAQFESQLKELGNVEILN